MEYQDYMMKKGNHPHHQQQQHQPLPLPPQIPSFGNWDYYDDIPVTQYFETARQAGLVRAAAGPPGYGSCAAAGHYYAPADADLFRVPPSPMNYHYHNTKALKSSQKLKHQGNVSSREQRRQVRVCDADAYPRKKPKAVDEDLYKIPPELLYQRRTKKVAMSGFWRCCLGMNCIA